MTSTRPLPPRPRPHRRHRNQSTATTATTTSDPSEEEEDDEKEEGQLTPTQGDWYEIDSIIDEKPTRYRVRWQGVDPDTLRPWKSDWVCLIPCFSFLFSPSLCSFFCPFFLSILFVHSFCSFFFFLLFGISFLSPFIIGFLFFPPMFRKNPSSSRGATGQEGRRDPRSRPRVGGAQATQGKQEAYGSSLRQQKVEDKAAAFESPRDHWRRRRLQRRPRRPRPRYQAKPQTPPRPARRIHSCCHHHRCCGRHRQQVRRREGNRQLPRIHLHTSCPRLSPSVASIATTTSTTTAATSTSATTAAPREIDGGDDDDNGDGGGDGDKSYRQAAPEP